MASIVLSAAGQAALPGIGGTALGALGRYAGGLADRKLGLTGGRAAAGPRLDNLKVQDSRYGAGIAIVYGRARVAGQVIWASDIIETAQEQSVGKGGGGVSATRYSYSAHCAVAIAAGPLARLASVWADGKLLYDGLNWKSGLAASAHFYPGDAAQNPDPVMEAALGAGNVPAYRGLAYVVFESLQLGDFGNRLPNLTFEVIANDAAAAPAAGLHADPAIQNIGIGLGARGGTPPLTVNGDNRRTGAVAVIGMGNAEAAAGDAFFTAVTYDVGGDAPLETGRASSATFVTDEILGGLGWSLSPDGRYAAMIAVTAALPDCTASLAIYDLQTRQFGAVTQLTAPGFPRAVGWLDALRFAVTDVSGGALGVRIFARAGLDIVALGFHGLWGAGSASSRHPVGMAQFIPLPGGLLHIAGDAALNPSALYACFMDWSHGALRAGTPYLISNAVPAFSLSQADILSFGGGEYIFCFSKTDNVNLLSFIPAADGATITRAWQNIALTAISTFMSPCRCQGRLTMIQKSPAEAYFRLSEIVPDGGGFTLTTDSVAVGGEDALGGPYYLATSLDDNRMLIQGGANALLQFSELRMISRHAGGDNLANIAADLMTRAGYESGDSALDPLAAVNLTGYALQPPLTARAALEPLRIYGDFDLIESDDKLKAVLRHGASAAASIPVAELRAAQENKAQPPALTLKRLQELDLPREITVDYLDPSRDFEAGSQRARRSAARATAHTKLSLPLVCGAAQAKQIAERRLDAAWTERTQSIFSLSRRYLWLDPGDVVQAEGRVLRLTSIRQAGGLMQCEAADYDANIFASNAIGDSGAPVYTAPQAPPSLLYLMDLPPLRGADNQPGIYAALSGAPGWRSGALWRAADGGDYMPVASFASAAVAGMALTALGGPARAYRDRANNVEVQLLQGSLASCSEAELLNGANAALLGGEIIQFQSAALLGPGRYRLSNLLRGRRGTDNAAGTHLAGEDFVLLNGGTVQFLPLNASDRGVTRNYRALSVGQNLGDAADYTVTYDLRSWRPFAPAHPRGVRSAGTGSDLALSWIRRARIDHEWLDLIDVPLDETQELYDLEILDGGDVVRTISGLTAPDYLYTAAQQSADFTVIPPMIALRVYQVSPRYGRGDAAEAVV